MGQVALWRRLLAEFLGSAFLAATVIGSGIAAVQLSPGNLGLELLENAIVTGTGLFAIILMFGAVSGAHFNPVVSFVDAAFGGMPGRGVQQSLPQRSVLTSLPPTSFVPRQVLPTLRSPLGGCSRIHLPVLPPARFCPSLAHK